MKKLIEGALIARAHSCHQGAIRLVHPLNILRTYRQDW
jgi:hypothetical protein